MNRRTVIVWVRWFALYMLVTVFFAKIAGKPELRISHGVLVYLLLIIATCREARYWLSMAMVVAGFAAVDWFFVPPIPGFGRPADFDLVILLGFIFTGIVITQLVSNLQRAAKLATDRAHEIESLSAQQLELQQEAARAKDSREAEAMKNALIASIAHDLRSPITTMKMLADPSYGIEPRSALARISTEADRINRYLSTMRHFSDVGATGALMSVESHVVDDLIGTAIASYAGVLRERAVTVRPAIDGEILLVRCDLTLSLQVLGNLLQNAARYSPPECPIAVSAGRQGAMVGIVVADRGPGVPPGEVELIFRARHQGPVSVGVHDGQGMGLAIARTFARAQLGDVLYRPRHGGGAEFVFMLPLSTELSAHQTA
ncbi:MAG: PAS domain-containing sensor histidine kinase [Gemmatimonadota bacterium]|nr:PAS domain-containing sensor histidine kinase [Gemmatimonadota bacterium]